MDDLISRQGAIDAILAIKDYGNSDRANALGLAEFAITTLPSAEKHGRWVVDSEGMLHCSTCKEIPTNRIVINASLIYDMTPIKEKMKYCPKCGAKMGVEE